MKAARILPEMVIKMKEVPEAGRATTVLQIREVPIRTADLKEGTPEEIPRRVI